MDDDTSRNIDSTEILVFFLSFMLSGWFLQKEVVFLNAPITLFPIYSCVDSLL